MIDIWDSVAGAKFIYDLSPANIITSYSVRKLAAHSSQLTTDQTDTQLLLTQKAAAGRERNRKNVGKTDNSQEFIVNPNGPKTAPAAEASVPIKPKKKKADERKKK